MDVVVPPSTSAKMSVVFGDVVVVKDCAVVAADVVVTDCDVVVSEDVVAVTDCDAVVVDDVVVADCDVVAAGDVVTVKDCDVVLVSTTSVMASGVADVRSVPAPEVDTLVGELEVTCVGASGGTDPAVMPRDVTLNVVAGVAEAVVPAGASDAAVVNVVSAGPSASVSVYISVTASVVKVVSRSSSVVVVDS